MYKKLTAILIFVCSFIAVSAQKNFSGKILDSAGNPIPGATISIKNSKVGTTSGPDGSFTIKGKDNASIMVTAVGFDKAEAQLTNEDNTVVHLTNTKRYLEEVVVTALGVKREKRNLTFSSQEVKGDEILKTKDPM